MQNRRRGQVQNQAAQSHIQPQQRQQVPVNHVPVAYRQPQPGQVQARPLQTRQGQTPLQGRPMQQPVYYAGSVQNPQPQPVPVAGIPSAKKRKTLKLAILLLILLNAAAFGLSLFWNALTFASQSAKQAEHERIVKNHPLYFRSDIEEKASRYNLQAAYVSAIIKNESSFRTDARSNVGALGLMQLMPDTAEWIAGKLGDSQYSFERLADGSKNMEYGCWYLNFLSNRFWGNPILTTAAYHTGQGKVANWLSDKNISQDGRSIALENMPDGPTKTYVRRVLESYAIYDALYFRNP